MNSSKKSKGLRTLKLLQKIKEGATNPASLSGSQRRPLVSFLMAEGQSTAEIAHLLKVSDRTIERDKKFIRQKNAISQDPELADIMAGRLVNEAQICIQRIRKFQRDTNCPPAAKIEGEKGCFQITNNLAERLQSMGYLPIAAKKLEADLRHHAENVLSLNEIESETDRLQGIRASLPKKRLKKVKSKIIKRKEKNHE